MQRDQSAPYKLQLKSACEELLARLRKLQESFPVMAAAVERARREQTPLEGGELPFS